MHGSIRLGASPVVWGGGRERGAASESASACGPGSSTAERAGACVVWLALQIIHDYEHKGVNNDYLIRVSDDLAVLYNDRSPMENHHLAASFQLLNSEEFNFMRKVPHKTKVSEVAAQPKCTLPCCLQVAAHAGGIHATATAARTRTACCRGCDWA